MHLVEYKFVPSVVKLLYPLKIKLNPIQNFIISLVNTSNRKQKPLDQAPFLLWLSRFCPDYFNEKYGSIKSTWIFLKNSIFKDSTPQALTKSLKANKTDASCCIYFVYISKWNDLRSNNKFKNYFEVFGVAMQIVKYLTHFKPSTCMNKKMNKIFSASNSTDSE